VQRAWKITRRWLYIVHRWVGIGSAVLFAMWFASGLIMMYVPYPALNDRERLTGLDPIDWAQVRVFPDQALRTAGLSKWPARFKLEMMAGEPVYRIAGDARWTVSARDGRTIAGVDAAQARAIATRFARWDGAAAVDARERDQWTVAGGYNAHRPLYRVVLPDPKGRTYYVSSKTGEVVLDTTRFERVWNWLGTVPHWIYFTELRKDQPAWRQVILWTSGFGIVGAVTGVWIGILRLRLKRRYHDNKVSPYRGWMKWHHVGGLVTGLTVTTWIVSGWLSVNPNQWFARSSPDPASILRYDGNGAARFPMGPAVARGAAGAREARFVWVAGRPEVVVSDADLRRTVLDARNGQRVNWSDAALFANARNLLPGVAMTLEKRLDAEDVYWYAHHAEPRLPMLRAGFADAASTWFHIDPLTGEVLGTMNRSDRTERWAFNFLHDFDLPVLLHSRPSWDILVWLLSIGGLVTSVTSVVIGWRRLKRKGEEIDGWRRKQAKKRQPAAAE
jgi:hypothetical protein